MKIDMKVTKFVKSMLVNFYQADIILRNCFNFLSIILPIGLLYPYIWINLHKNICSCQKWLYILKNIFLPLIGTEIFNKILNILPICKTPSLPPLILNWCSIMKIGMTFRVNLLSPMLPWLLLGESSLGNLQVQHWSMLCSY